jgi:hypothetical protein
MKKGSPLCGDPNKLHFFNSDGVGFANFHTGFAAKAFISIDRVGLAVNEFVHFYGAHVYALAATHTLVSVNNYIITHCIVLQRIN